MANSKVVVLLPPSEASAAPYERVTLRADDFRYVAVGDTGRHMVLQVFDGALKAGEFEAAMGAFLLDNHQGG